MYVLWDVGFLIDDYWKEPFSCSWVACVGVTREKEGCDVLMAFQAYFSHLYVISSSMKRSTINMTD